MDYSKVYIELMERSFIRKLEGYVEKHHVVPVCMGGDNKERNLAILTPEEHYLAHQLLVKIYPKNHKLAYAATAMCMYNGGYIRNNKMFGWVNRKRIENMRGAGNPMFGKTHSAEAKLKISTFRRNFKVSKETGRKISIANSGPNNPNYGKVGNQSQFSKKVSQFTKNGKYIKTFDSAASVQRELNISPCNISLVCNLKLNFAGGFSWQFGDSQILKNIPIISESPNGKGVSQYSKAGEILNTFKSMSEAYRNTNVDHSDISRCCAGKKKSAGGFIWKYYNEAT